MSVPRSFREMLHRADEALVPVDVSIELTHRCNYRCVHCLVPDHDIQDGLSTERILSLLDELAEMGTLVLSLSGGEPLCRSDWETVARRARRLGFLIHFLTNASLVDEAVADTLAELDAAVEVSLYSMKPEVFDGITRVPGSHARTLRGIGHLGARPIPLLLKAPVMAVNRDCLSDVFAFAAGIGAECQAYARITHRKDGNLAPIEHRLEGDRLVEFFRSGFSSCRTPSSAEDGRSGRPCGAGSRYANISADGSLLACNVLPGSAGNLREVSFRSLWESSPFLQRVRAIRRSDLHHCHDCDKLTYCGRCHAQALVEDGDLLGRQLSACARALALEEAFDRPA